jgi:hypothetical protein
MDGAGASIRAAPRAACPRSATGVGEAPTVAERRAHPHHPPVTSSADDPIHVAPLLASPDASSNHSVRVT